MLNFAKILISVFIILVSLGSGLYLRRRLVQYLKKSVFDNWITQTLGMLVTLLPLTVGGTIALAVLKNLENFLNDLSSKQGINLYSLGGQLLGTILLIAFGIGIARTVQSLTLRGLGEKRIDINLRTFISRIFYFFTLIIIGFWTLSIWNIPLGIPATAIGLVTVLVSFAVQDILKDLVAGFYLLVERPFFIHNQIRVTVGTDVYVGTVEDIQLRATKLRLVSGEEITIPNVMLFSGTVINNTYYSERRVAITATLPEADFSRDETVERIQNTLAEISCIKPKPEPTILLSKYAGDKVTLLVRFWMGNIEAVDMSEPMHILHELLPTAELTVVEPSPL